jgi:hypothetical protein
MLLDGWLRGGRLQRLYISGVQRLDVVERSDAVPIEPGKK